MSGPGFIIPDLPRDRPTVPEVMPLVQALYARHPCGCCWHVVLDDGNYDCVPYCVSSIEKDGCFDGGDTECYALAKLLPLMSKTQLRRLARSKR